MEKKWGPQRLKKYEMKVNGKSMETTTTKTCFYKVSGKYIRTIKNIKC